LDDRKIKIDNDLLIMFSMILTKYFFSYKEITLGILLTVITLMLLKIIQVNNLFDLKYIYIYFNKNKLMTMMVCYGKDCDIDRFYIDITNHCNH
jgi:hypothetical protein